MLQVFYGHGIYEVASLPAIDGFLGNSGRKWDEGNQMGKKSSSRVFRLLALSFPIHIDCCLE